MKFARVFLSPGDPLTAANQPGIPRIGDVETIDGFVVKCNAYNVKQTTTPEVSEVTCVYTNDNAYSGTDRIDEESREFRIYEMNVGTTTVEVPRFRLYNFVIPNPGGGFGTAALSWQQDNFRMLVSTIGLNVRLSINRWRLEDSVNIANRVGELHKFGGLSWKFNGANIALREWVEDGGAGTPAGRWHIDYSWTHEEGVFPPDLSELTTEERDRVLTITEAAFPFERWIVIPSDDLEGGRPIIKTIQPYRVDDLGWQDLPGRPIQ